MRKVPASNTNKNLKSGVEKVTKKSPQTKETMADIKPDETAKELIQEEHAESNNENLLNSQTPSE